MDLEKPGLMDAPTMVGIRLPAGLLGFESHKEFLLVANPAEEPLLWLQAQGDATLAFVVMDPFLAAPDYQPDLPTADVEAIGLENAGDAMLLNIVTVHAPNRATVNLKGPIVINRHTRVGRQVVIANATEYSVQHPLPLS